MLYALKHLDLIFLYTKSKLQAEAERTYLGYFWWVLDPLVGVAIYYVLFKLFLKRGGPDYIPFLFLGLITWKWFENGVSRSAETLLGAASIFKKVQIHKSVFPSVEVLYHTWKFLIVFLFVILVYAIVGYTWSLPILTLPIVLLVQFVLIYGIGLFVASVTPFLPDIKFFVGYSMRLLFYPSGIIFDVARIPEKYQYLIKINFLTGLIKSYRNIIMYQEFPDWFALAYCLVVGIVFVLVSSWILEKYDKVYAKIC